MYRCYEGTEASRDTVYDSLPVDNVDAIALICRRPLEDHHIDASFTAQEKRDSLVLSDSLFAEAVASIRLAAVRARHVQLLQDAAESFAEDESLQAFATGLLHKRCEAYAALDEGAPANAVVVIAQRHISDGATRDAIALLDQSLS